MYQYFIPLLLNDFFIVWAPHLAYPLETDEHLGFWFLSVMNEAANNITLQIFLNFIIKNVINFKHTHINHQQSSSTQVRTGHTVDFTSVSGS